MAHVTRTETIGERRFMRQLYILVISLTLSACGDGDISSPDTPLFDTTSRNDVSERAPDTGSPADSSNIPLDTIDTPTPDTRVGDSSAPEDIISDANSPDAVVGPLDVGSADTELPEGDPWDAVRTFVDSKLALSNATVLIGDTTGTLFSYSRGESTAESTYTIASASKLITAITILRVIESGDLELMSKASAVLPFWVSDETDPRYDITLEQLLSFTSGFSGGSGLNPNDPALPCVEDAQASTADCAEMIHGEAFEFPPAGTTFFYGPPHMYVAAAMAMQVRSASTWNAIFRAEIANDLGLPLVSGFLAPSLKNGRPAGGARMSGSDYASILTALSAGELLSPTSIAALTMDHTPTASVTMGYVPKSATQNGNWHYALGCWRECESSSYDAGNCDAPGVISSPGAFGFYPWWDQANEHWGVIAVQLNSPNAAATTSLLGKQIRELAIPILQTL